jgi:uncharacterized protein involved in outer membrane biogenesis
MKKGLIILTGVLLLTIILLVFLASWIDLNDLVATRIPDLEKKIHRKISIGDVRLKLLKGPGLEIADVHLFNRPEGGQTFIGARHITIGFQLLPLLKREIHLERIILQAPSILIERNATGQFNFDDILHSLSSTDPRTPGIPEKETSKDVPVNINISTIEMREGHLHFRDAMLPEPLDIRLKRMDAGITFPAGDKPGTFSIKGQANLDHNAWLYDSRSSKPGDIPFQMALQAQPHGISPHKGITMKSVCLQVGDISLQANAEIHDREQPHLQADLQMYETDLGNLDVILPMLGPWQLQGRIQLFATAQGSMNELINLKGITAQVKLDDAALTLPQTGSTIDRIHAALSVQNGGIHLHDTIFHYGERSALDIDARIENIQQSHLKLTIQSSFLDLDEILSSASPSQNHQTTTQDKAKSASAPESQKPSTPSLAPELQASGTIQIAKGIYQKTDFENFHAFFHYEPPLISLNSLKIDIFSGTISGSGKMDIEDLEHPVWQTQLDSRNLDMNSLMASLAGIRNIVQGQINGELQLEGQGRQLANITRSLNGNGQGTILNGELTTINLLDIMAENLLQIPAAAPVARVLFPEQTRQAQNTKFEDITGNFEITGGNIKMDRLQLETDDYRIKAEGLIGLDRALHLNADLHLLPSLTQSLAEHKLYRYLLDEKGNLHLPFVLKGSMMRPVIQLDPAIIEKSIRQSAEKTFKGTFEKHLEKARERLNRNLPDFFQ